MIVIVSALGGAAWGACLAKSREGSRLDMAQYGAGFAIAFALLGLFLTIFIERMA